MRGVLTALALTLAWLPAAIQQKREMKACAAAAALADETCAGMTPREFLANVVQPNVAEFRQHYTDMRHAHNAISAVDALAAHVYAWCLAHVPHEVAGRTDDSDYRGFLAGQNANFGVLRDIAKAQKHVHLTRGNPQVSTAAQVNTRPIGWGEGKFGHGRYGGPAQLVVDLNSGSFEYVERVIDSALNFLEAEMTRIGL